MRGQRRRAFNTTGKSEREWRRMKKSKGLKRLDSWEMKKMSPSSCAVAEITRGSEAGGERQG